MYEDYSINSQWQLNFGEFNGDALLDLLLSSDKSGMHAKAFFSTPSGFASPQTIYESSNTTDEWQVRVGDVNGDGKSDIYYYLQNFDGSSKVSQIKVMTQVSNGINFNDVNTIYDSSITGYFIFIPIDLNSDRKSDFLFKIVDNNKCDSEYKSAINNGGNFTIGSYYSKSESGAEDDCGWNFAVTDFNGDLHNELSYVFQNSANKTAKMFYSNSGFVPFQKVINIENPSGGKMIAEYMNKLLLPQAVNLNQSQCSDGSSVGYGASCGIASARSNILTLKETYDDGRGHLTSKQYEYFNDRIYPATFDQRKSLGFEKIRTTIGPANNFMISVIRQDVPYQGRIDKELNYNANGQLMEKKIFTYGSSTTSVFGTNYIEGQVETTQHYESGMFTRQSTTTRQYDAYGNILVTKEQFGATALTVTEKQYQVNLQQWVLNENISEKIIDDGTIIKWENYVYNNHKRISIKKYLNTEDRWITASFNFDQYGNTIAKIDPLGNVESLEMDTVYHKFEIRKVNVLGQESKIMYDDLWVNPSVVVNSNGGKVEYKYDALSRPTEVIKPGDDWTERLAYVNTGSPVEQYIEQRYHNDSPEGFRYQRNYLDGFNRVYKQVHNRIHIDENGVDTTHEVINEFEFYGTNDDVFTKKSVPYIEGFQTPKFTTLLYDSYGRNNKTIFADGKVEYIVRGPLYEKKYNAAGHYEKVFLNERGAISARENYDKNNNLLSRLKYIHEGLKETIIDADNQSHVTVLDTLEREIARIDFGNSIWKSEYNDNDQLIVQIDPKQQKMEMQYDALNRVVSVNYDDKDSGDATDEHDETKENHSEKSDENDEKEDHSDEDYDIKYVYDDPSLANSIGQLSHVYDESGTTSYSYDPRGNIINMKKEVHGRTFTFSATYNSENKVTGITYPDGYIAKNTYSNSRDIKQVRLHKDQHDIDGYPVVSYVGPTEDFRIMRVTSNGVIDAIKINPDTQKVVSVQTTSKSDEFASLLRDYDYNYDSLGNIQQITDNLKADYTEQMQYDGLNRLVNAKGIYGDKQYSYSAGGNLTKKGSKTLYYENAQLPQAVTRDSTGKQYTYNVNGNVIKTNHRSYQYNGNNQVRKMIDYGVKKNNADYRYDYNGKRAVKKEQNGKITYYFYFIKEHQPLYEVSVSNKSDVEDNDHESKNKTEEGEEDIDDERFENHTKYIFGSKEDRVLQLTESQPSYLALSRTNDTILASMINGGTFTGVTLKSIAVLSVWTKNNLNKFYITIFFFSVFTLCFLGLFIYNRIALKDQIQLYKKNRLHYYSMPVLFVTFSWCFAAGCGNTNPNNLMYANPNDAPWAHLPVDYSDDIIDISEELSANKADDQAEDSDHKEKSENHKENKKHGKDNKEHDKDKGHELKSQQQNKYKNKVKSDIAHRGFPVAGAYFFHPDQAGSVRLMTNSAGRVTTRINYLPYGEIDRENSSGPDISRYKYTGQEEDIESGDYNYNARIYNPRTGRFNTPDTVIPGDNKLSQGFNRHMYTIGNPVNHTDKSGNIFGAIFVFIIASPFIATAIAWGTIGLVNWIASGSNDINDAFWGYNYAGINNRDSTFKKAPTSYFDAVAMQHDKADAVFFTNPRMAKMNATELLVNIMKDIWLVGMAVAPYALMAVPILAPFIIAGLLITNFLAFYTMNESKFTNGNAGDFLLYLIIGIVYAAIMFIADAFMALASVLFFAINIVIAAVIAVVKALKDALDWLFNTCFIFC